MRLTRFTLLALVVALVLSVSAYASYQYAAYQSWGYLQDASSTYASNWTQNWFQKDAQGFDTTVTFIDNSTYSWHNTVRNTYKTTATTLTWSGTTKAYCQSHTTGFFGSCTVFT